MRTSILTTASFAALSAFAALPAADFTVDSVHSAALFKIKHIDVAYTYGRFTKIDGKLSLDQDVSKNQISITIPVASLNTDDTKRDEHLRGADFFDAKQFPNMTFTSTAWKSVDANTSMVTGNLTLLGVSKPVTVTVTKVGEVEKSAFGDHRVGYETTFAIKRSDFGMSKMTDKIGDEVSVTFGIEAIKAK